MKKNVLYFLIPFLGLGSIFAQTAKEEKSDFSKKVIGVNSITITLPFNSKTVEAVVQEQLKSGTKSKGKGEGDNTIFENVVFPAVSPLALTYGCRVQKLAKDDDKNAKVTLFLRVPSSGEFMSSGVHPTEFAAAQKWLEKLPLPIQIFEKEEAIKTQTATIEKEQNKEKNLAKEKSQLEKTLAETQKELEKNTQTLEEQRKLIEVAKELNTTLLKELEALKASK
jgi:hypothetical protein